MRTCFRCEEQKDEAEFAAGGYCRPCQKAYHREWYERNREAKLAKNRAWKEANRETYLAQQQAYRTTEKRREAQRILTAEWRENNPERNREAGRRSDKKNRQNRYDNAHRYRARRRGAALVEKVDRPAVYERDNGMCHICNHKVARKSFTLDHLVPLSRGGDHTAINLRVAHFSCNSRRGAGRLPAQLLLIAA